MNNNEKIYNCFAIVKGEYIEEIAIKEHNMIGTDEEKEKFLKSREVEDFKDARRFPVSENFIISNFGEKDRVGTTYDFFEHLRKQDEELAIFYQALEELKSPESVLYNIAVFKDNKLLQPVLH